MWEKKKLLVTSNFSFSHIVFYPFAGLFAIVINFETRLQTLSIWKSLKFVVWERDNERCLLLPSCEKKRSELGLVENMIDKISQEWLLKAETNY